MPEEAQPASATAPASQFPATPDTIEPVLSRLVRARPCASHKRVSSLKPVDVVCCAATSGTPRRLSQEDFFAQPDFTEKLAEWMHTRGQTLDVRPLDEEQSLGAPPPPPLPPPPPPPPRRQRSFTPVASGTALGSSPALRPSLVMPPRGDGGGGNGGSRRANSRRHRHRRRASAATFAAFQEYAALVEACLGAFLERERLTGEQLFAACQAARESGDGAWLTCVDYLLSSVDYDSFLRLVLDFQGLRAWDDGGEGEALGGEEDEDDGGYEGYYGCDREGEAEGGGSRGGAGYYDDAIAAGGGAEEEEEEEDGAANAR